MKRGFITLVTPEYYELALLLQRSIKERSRYHLHVTLATSGLWMFTRKLVIEAHINTPFDETCWLDCDTFALRNIDDIWGFIKDDPLPLFQPQPQKPDLKWEEMQEKLGGPFDITAYRHSAPALYTKKALWFFLEAYKAYDEHERLVSGQNEPIINVLSWKHKATEYLPYCIVDRTFLHLEGKVYNRETLFAVHGEKDPTKANQLYDKME